LEAIVTSSLSGDDSPRAPRPASWTYRPTAIQEAAARFGRLDCRIAIIFLDAAMQKKLSGLFQNAADASLAR
jgi:hypothetical protein